MTIPRDHYEVLGVSRDATAKQIHRAFRARARQLHPDVSAREDAAVRFQEVSTAYEVLNDPRRRAQYDLVTVKPPRPMFTSRRGRSDVPRFVDEHQISFGPIVIRISTVSRWLS